MKLTTASWIRLAVILSLLFGPAAPGLAQEEEETEYVEIEELPDQDLDTARMHKVGPVYFQPSVRIKDVGYDDNVRFHSQEPVGDFTASAVGTLDALVLGKRRGGIRISQSFDYVSFRSNSDQNHLNSTTRGRGILLLRPVILSMEELYSSTRERPYNEIDTRIRREENVFTVAARSRGTGRLQGRAYLRNHSFRYGDEIEGSGQNVQQISRDEFKGTLIGELKILPKTRFTLETSRSKIDFTETFRVGRANETLAGLAFEPNAAFQGYFKVGRVNLNFTEAGFETFRAWVGEGELSSRVGGRGRVRLEFDREYGFSTLNGHLFYVSTTWTAVYEQYFSRSLSAELKFGRGLIGYPEEGALPGITTLPSFREDRITSQGFALKYHFSRRVALSAGVQRFDRDSNVDALDRDRNLYTVGSEIVF